MDLDKINVTLRPRNGWQSIDLGFQMARQWFLPLATLWLCLALPGYLILKLLPLPGYATLVIWWWFKPLYEAPLSFWCSRAMFSDPVSHRQALSAAWRQLPKLLSSYLSIRRLSTSRSQDMNIVMLENLTGTARRQRISVLNRMTTRTFALITACFHFEALLFYGIFLAAFALLPSNIPMEHSFGFFFGDEPNAISTTVTEVTTVIVGAMIAPFYVCAGFALYINRRTQLEAWDVELDFRRASSRERGGHSSLSQKLAVLIVAVMITGTTIQPSDASTTSDESKTIIEAVLSDPDFGSTEKAKRLVLKDFDQEDDDETDSNSPWLSEAGKWLRNIAEFIEAFLWAIFAIVLILLAIAVYRNSPVMQEFVSRLGWQQKDQTGSKVFDLDIRPQTLPKDIPATAKAMLQDGRKREAMSLLYRGALSRLVHQHGMTIHTSATEHQCVTQVIDEQPDYRSSGFKQLTTLWQRTAYAQSAPEDQHLYDICNQWQAAFDGDAHD